MQNTVIKKDIGNFLDCPQMSTVGYNGLMKLISCFLLFSYFGIILKNVFKFL